MLLVFCWWCFVFFCFLFCFVVVVGVFLGGGGVGRSRNTILIIMMVVMAVIMDSSVFSSHGGHLTALPRTPCFSRNAGLSFQTKVTSLDPICVGIKSNIVQNPDVFDHSPRSRCF